MCHANNEKQKKTDDGRNKTTKLRKKSGCPKKRKHTNTEENLEANIINDARMKEKNQNSASQENKKITPNYTI